jgi:arsenate reductase
VPVRVLFLCTHNSARSQIAEALLRAEGGPSFQAASAGTAPRGLHPLTLQVLREAGIEPGPLRSKGVTEFLEAEFDYVITVCDDANEACPVFPGAAKRLHWSLPDPSAAAEEKALEAFRAVRDELKERVRSFARSTSHDQNSL